MSEIALIQGAHEIRTPNGGAHMRSVGPDIDRSSLGRASRSPGAARGADHDALFTPHRARLFAIACRMLGSRADAEDIVQDVYVRWHEAAGRDIQSSIGFLVTITIRLCLDRLRHWKKKRERYAGSWLPEAIAEDYVPSPEEQCEMAGEVSVAFLAVLERLGTEERVAFLLREVFDYDYPEVARVVGKSEAACRQLVHRALSRLREARARFVVAAESRERVLQKFFAATGTGNRQAVLELLAEEVEYMAIDA